MNKLLTVYITHQGSVDKSLNKIENDTIVVVGGHAVSTFENGLLRLNCDDSYCGLPDKITKLFKFISESSEFSEYTHICKLDEDMVFLKDIDFEFTDYMGIYSYKENASRGNHIGRCKDHYWNDKFFEGEIYDWCDGGYGYIISRKAFEIVAKVDGTKYPLEDLMVASVLGQHGIFATRLDIDNYYEPKIKSLNRIKTFKDIKDRKWEDEDIPKWIFKTGPFKLEDLPDLMREIYLDILIKNPGYELFYFSNEDCMLSIHHHYGEEYFRLHQKLIPTAYQADFWRYLILNQYGGCYGDFSQIPLVSYDELTEGVERVFVRDDPSNKSFLYNAIMCCKPNDSVVSRAIDISVDNIRNNKYGAGTLDVTGPTVLGQAFFQRKFNLNPYIKEISLGDYKGSRILQHRYSGGFVCTKGGKNVFITKLANHNTFVYANNHNNLHYDRAWREGRVYKY